MGLRLIGSLFAKEVTAVREIKENGNWMVKQTAKSWNLC